MEHVYLTKEYIERNIIGQEKRNLFDGPWLVISENVISEYNYDGAFSRGEEIYYNLKKDDVEIYQIPQRFIAPISEVREDIIKQILE
jgi:hypothetical protein